jgi:hypothetical protein
MKEVEVFFPTLVVMEGGGGRGGERKGGRKGGREREIRVFPIKSSFR